MSRYQPPARDRSPARYDRRPSAYGAGSSYRGSGESAAPIDRDPPRGPRADSFRGGYPYATPARGRGAGAFPARSADTWNRDRDRDRDRERDARPPQAYRAREDDRPDWNRRDRDLGPPDRPPVVARDTRPYPPRERSASPVRARRDSRESLPPLNSRQSDSVASFRGGLGRGRGRGDWDRMRGRSTFVGDRERERDLFSNRSPSRDGIWRDREYDRGRASGPEVDRPDRFERRERSRERRDHDIWQRDPSPARAGSGPAARAPSPAHSAGHYGPADRTTKMDYEMTRRPSAVTATSAPGREPRRDGEQTDYFGRSELRRESSHSSLYQPAAPPSSAIAGLDYGPPPSAPSTTPSEKPPAVQAKPAKPVSPAVTAPPFQPPSGPKADRALSNASSAAKPPMSSEPPRPDLAMQSSRAVPTGSPPELFPKKMEQKSEPRPSITQTPDKAMPPNVPSGPRSSFGPSFRARPQLSESGTSFLTPKQSTSDVRGPSIPTGPRSDRERENMRDVREGRDGPWPPTQPGGSSRSWISPEYNRAKPSIMSPINRDRPAFAPTGPRSQSILPPSGDKARPFQPSIMAGSTPAATASKAGSVESGRSLGALPKERGPSEDVDMSLPVSSDEEADEDEFDEDDFAASEEKFAKERKALEARKPPPLLHDMILRGLLVKMQFLSMIASRVAVETVESKAEADEPMKGLEHAQIGLPSPEELSEEQERPEVKHPQPRGRPLREPPVNPIPTPPVEDLPYLSKPTSQPTVFDDSDDEVQHESITTHIRQEFERQAFDWQDELQEMSTDYRKQYAAWKDDLVSLHQPVRELQLSPAPVSPAPSAAPSVTPSANHERTRGGRNTTEADLQAAIALSQQTMKEEEERREREAASSSVPNFDHEAVVPAMIKPTDAELSQFEDTNRLIPPELALEIFAYLPPEDDFTEEEQLAFIQGYCQTPKKWGKIAEGLPGRTYQDCITHYYLTKSEAKYKDIWRRNQPKRRRGRNATKPRSTALMSELAYRAGEEASVAVTDTGRPRRAAAPTFGDTAADSDPSTMAPAAKRLAVSGKEATPDGTAKPGRGRKTGTKTRRTKAQILADQLAAQAAQSTTLLPANLIEASPQKIVAQKERSRTLLRAGDNGMPKTDLVQGLDMPKLAEPEMPQYGIPDSDRLVPAATSHTPNQPTSYWSVPEQQKFPQLIAYYGRDFPAVADFMKTKTSTMIKNHYNRQIAEGKLDLEELAKAAELKRANNEPMGPPPSPAIQTKRRYEATPSTASPQHGRIVAEQHMPEPEPTILPSKAGYTEDFPSNTVQRTFAGEIVAKARSGRDLMQEPPVVQSKTEEPQRPTGLPHKPLVGPRSGFFKEENPAFGMPHQARSRDNSPHQHPLRPGEHRLGDLGHGVPAGSPRQLNLGPARDLGGLVPHPPASTSLPNSSLQSDRFGIPQQHSRNGSMGGVTSASLDQARELAALRQMDLVPRQYSMVPPQTATPPPASSAPLRRTESGHGHGSAPPPEPPKPTPAKRSNINSLLNDDPPEPKPVKRSSFDSQKRAAMMSPQAVPHHGSPFDPSRNPFRLDGSPGDLDRNIRTPLSSLGPHPLREQQQPGYHSGQTPTPNEDWLGRYDPRPQSGLGEQRTLHQSPRTAHYSVVPPSTGGSNLRMEAPRPLDPDHRRSLLGGLSHPGPNPSPPPQQHMPSYRSLAGSGQQVHSRVSSANYAHGQTSQGPPHQLQHTLAGPPSHPQSSSSTPVSSLQHGRPSLDLGAQQRQTIQQHMAHLQQQQRDPPPSYRDRDHEQALQRQRELEAQQQQMRAPDRERDIYGHRRDVLGYGSAPPREQDTQPPAHGHQQQQQRQQQQYSHHPHQPPHLSAQSAGPGQPRPYGYPPEPVQRSYTPQPPPPQHPPYQPSHTPGPPSQIHHHQHLQGGQPKAQMQGPAPPPGVHATNHGTYGHGHSHYRTISSDERRYE